MPATQVYKAGTSKRLVKSPDAPKITTMHGALVGLLPGDSSPMLLNVRLLSNTVNSALLV